MSKRRTRVILSIPWDDEEQDHPAHWGYDVLLGIDASTEGEGVLLIDFWDPPSGYPGG